MLAVSCESWFIVDIWPFKVCSIGIALADVCLFQLAELVSLSCFSVRCTHSSDRLHDNSVTLPSYILRVSMQIVSFLLWNSWPAKFSPLSFDINRVTSVVIDIFLHFTLSNRLRNMIINKPKQKLIAI